MSGDFNFKACMHKEHRYPYLQGHYITKDKFGKILSYHYYCKKCRKWQAYLND